MIVTGAVAVAVFERALSPRLSKVDTAYQYCVEERSPRSMKLQSYAPPVVVAMTENVTPSPERHTW
jgi:hypothetical protein